jgi:hypothetical protein
MAANRADGLGGAIRRVWGRGGFFGCKLILLGDQANNFSLSGSHSMGE